MMANNGQDCNGYGNGYGNGYKIVTKSSLNIVNVIYLDIISSADRLQILHDYY